MPSADVLLLAELQQQRGKEDVAYLVPKGEVAHGVLSCQGDAAEQDEKQDQVGENVIIDDPMAVHTEPARDTRGTTLALREQRDLGNISLSWASRTRGLPCRAQGEPVQGRAASPHSAVVSTHTWWG